MFGSDMLEVGVGLGLALPAHEFDMHRGQGSHRRDPEKPRRRSRTGDSRNSRRMKKAPDLPKTYSTILSSMVSSTVCGCSCLLAPNREDPVEPSSRPPDRKSGNWSRPPVSTREGGKNSSNFFHPAGFSPLSWMSGLKCSSSFSRADRKPVALEHLERDSFVRCVPSVTILLMCKVGGGRAFALPPSARSNGSCGFPASRFPVWSSPLTGDDDPPASAGAVRVSSMPAQGLSLCELVRTSAMYSPARRSSTLPTARGLPPPVGHLDPTGVAARPAAIRGLLL